MESFIYRAINKASRETNSSYVETLGPYAVLISRVISRAQRNRDDNIVGEFMIFRGISLPPSTIRKWRNGGFFGKLNFLNLDGYSATSLDQNTAV